MRKAQRIIFCLLVSIFQSCDERKERNIIVTNEVQDTIKPVLLAELKAGEPIIETIIETGDVKGVITSHNKVTIHKVKVKNVDGNFEIPVIKLDNNSSIKILPVKGNFKVLKSNLEKQLKGKGTLGTINKRENGWLYKLTTVSDSVSYNFLVYVGKKKSQYALSMVNESAGGAKNTEEGVTEAYNTALSFVPSEK